MRIYTKGKLNVQKMCARIDKLGNYKNKHWDDIFTHNISKNKKSDNTVSWSRETTWRWGYNGNIALESYLAPSRESEGLPWELRGKESACTAGDPSLIPGSPVFLSFPGGSDGKESVHNKGDLGSIPGLGRSPKGGHGHPLQYSCLQNPMDREAWRAIVHGVTKSRTPLSD